MQSQDEIQDKGQTGRVDEVAENLRDQHRSTLSTFQAYSIAIDESTGTGNIAQLAIFIRRCVVNLKINEELLEVIPMHNTTTGADIFDVLMEVVMKYKLPLDKLFHLFTSPLSIDIELVDDNLQMELIEIQCDSLLKQTFMEVGIPDFYAYLSIDRFPKILSFVTRIMAMFETTYSCEQLFSLMKNNKNSKRSRLTDKHLSSILKIASAQHIQPNFADLLHEKRRQTSSKK
ncbi:general transcription factor II-I repeat domain-containing protein 2A [Trichonephila clavipes]|nr:general transcription factor II-I repeat domain-containing protein 2A [Trichonephila clavipes]